MSQPTSTENIRYMSVPKSLIGNDEAGTGLVGLDNLSIALLGSGALGAAMSAIMTGLGATVARATLFQLQAVPVVVGAVALVLLDADVAKRGIYEGKAGFWLRIADLPADAAQLSATIALQAKLGSEAARDIAFGYLSDIAAEKEVPIFSTIEGLAAIPVEAGLQTIRVNGGSSEGDGRGGIFNRVVEEPEHFSKFPSAGSQWWELKSIDINFHNSLVAEIANDMVLGLPVLGAELGDSLTLGADPLNADNNYIADYPAPAEMERFLRNWSNNPHITYQNLGLSGFDTHGFLSGANGIIPTFAQKIAILKSQGCRFVTISLCMNDMQDSTPTGTRTFKFNLIAMEQIGRAAGMAVIFKTPNPAFGVPGVGTLDKAERSKHYAQIVREVSRATGAVLCDIYNLFMQIQSTGIWPIQSTLPDGIHPSNEIAGIYRAIGQYQAAAFCHPHKGFDEPEQYLAAGGPGTTCYPTEGATEARQTAMGLQVISSDYDGPKTLTMLALVETTGLDVYIAYPMWIGGAPVVNLLVDGIKIKEVSLYNVGNYEAYYVQQHEVLAIKNATPGLHMIQLSVESGTGSVAANYLRTRQHHHVRTFRNSAPSVSKSRLLAPELRMQVTDGSNAICLFDQLPGSRINDVLDIEFYAQLGRGEFFITNGLWAANNSSGKAAVGTAFGCASGSGNAQIREGEGLDSFFDTTLNLVDNTTIERSWRIVIPPGLNQLATVYIDGNAYPSHQLIKPYLGGWMGLQKQGNGVMVVRNLRVLEH